MEYASIGEISHGLVPRLQVFFAPVAFSNALAAINLQFIWYESTSAFIGLIYYDHILGSIYTQPTVFFSAFMYAFDVAFIQAHYEYFAIAV